MRYEDYEGGLNEEYITAVCRLSSLYATPIVRETDEGGDDGGIQDEEEEGVSE